MASKLDRFKARVKSMQEGTKRVGMNTLHTGETLVVGSAAAYAEGRMSKADGEWGYKNVPYLYVGGGFLLITGLIASATGGASGGQAGSHLMAAGSGLVGGHLFRTMYEAGLEAKNKAPATTTGRPVRQVGPGIRHGTQAAQQKTHVPMGGAFDGVS